MSLMLKVNECDSVPLSEILELRREQDRDFLITRDNRAVEVNPGIAYHLQLLLDHLEQKPVVVPIDILWMLDDQRNERRKASIARLNEPFDDFMRRLETDETLAMIDRMAKELGKK